MARHRRPAGRVQALMVALASALLAQAAAAGQAEAADAVQEVRLGQPALAATEAGRADLAYLAYCALDDRTVLVAEHDGVQHRFPGVVGLAPRWFAQPLSLAEQHWVSACMLALQNHTGAKVEVSLHLPERPHAGVKTAWMDRGRQYPLAEGRYFGNLFAAEPVAYVCSPAWSEAEAARWRARQRLCALPLAADAQGVTRTVCDMVHVGPCEPGRFTQGGVTYAGSVQVYLPSR